MNLKLDKNEQPEATRVFTYINIAMAVAFALILVRLWHLQIIKGEDFRNLSANNRIRIQDIPAPRGILYDREGIPLVDSFPAFDVSLYRQDLRRPETLIRPLSQTLSLDLEKLQARLAAAKEPPPSQAFKIKANISREELALVETRRLDLPGVMVDVVIRRNYPYGPLASHVIGHLGEISQEELEKEAYGSHKLGYLVGKYGIEQKYELELMGESGGRQIEVNAMGRMMRVLGTVEPNPGNNLSLTLDLELQKAAAEALAGKNGAVVALDPRNGDILAMVSKPDFDPNFFARGITPDNWKSIIGNPARPLQNRATQGQYPPGSVFKIVTALAALEEKAITPDTVFSCSGAFPFGNRDYHCWKKEGHGRVDLRRAIVESCDVYFYQVGLRLGVTRSRSHLRLEIEAFSHSLAGRGNPLRGHRAGIQFSDSSSGRVLPLGPVQRRHLFSAPDRPIGARPRWRDSSGDPAFGGQEFASEPRTRGISPGSAVGGGECSDRNRRPGKGPRVRRGRENRDLPGYPKTGRPERSQSARIPGPRLVRLLRPGSEPGDHGRGLRRTRRRRRGGGRPRGPKSAGELFPPEKIPLFTLPSRPREF
ncbi:MAG: penicillin-binding protein 2 [Deltaproteobacteria bacterium]|nr:penicillin-binding protein 2 [Deltaproteobacteria bacterium]